jgi:hypothetical protein
MWCEDGESGHGINRQRLRYSCRQRLGKEGNSALSLTARGEKFALEPFVPLGNKERRSSKTSTSAFTCVYLVVKQLLHVVNRQQMLSVHRYDDGIPNLRNQHLL